MTKQRTAFTSAICGLAYCLITSGAFGAETPADADRPSEVGATDAASQRWSTYVGLGAQFLPDYDETGRTSGLSNQEFFALVTADGRFGADCSGAANDRFHWCSNPLRGPWHTGLSLTLLGTPVKREDRPSISPNEFNDVARSVIMSHHVYLPFVQTADKVDNFGFMTRVSAISRETLGTNDDSVTWMYGLGVQYTNEGFREATKDGQGSLNGTPAGYIRAYAARFEDYAGFGKSTRFMTDAAIRLSSNLDLYLGFQGNFGEGPDEMAVVLSFVRTPDQLASLFNLGKK